MWDARDEMRRVFEWGVALGERRGYIYCFAQRAPRQRGSMGGANLSRRRLATSFG